MRAILLILTIICFKSYSQDLEWENFKLEEGNLIWEKVYETELSSDEILKSFKISGIIKDIDTLGNSITGTIKNLDLDYKGFGKTEMNTAMYISRSYFKSFIFIYFYIFCYYFFFTWNILLVIMILLIFTHIV